MIDLKLADISVESLEHLLLQIYYNKGAFLKLVCIRNEIFKIVRFTEFVRSNVLYDAQ